MVEATRAADIVPDSGVSVGLTIEEAKASFARSLRAANNAPRTVQTYLDALGHFERFLAARGMPREGGAIRREHVEAFLVALQDSGRRAASVANRYRSLQQFFRWLVEDDEIQASPLARMRAPAVPVQPPEVLQRGAAAGTAQGVRGERLRIPPRPGDHPASHRHRDASRRMRRGHGQRR